MTYHTNFKCHECRKRYFTKQALSPVNGHLYCCDCIEKMPPVEIIFFSVEYLTKRGLKKSTTLKVDTEQEAREYTFSRLKAKEVTCVERR